MLLDFRATNFRSIDGEVALNLVSTREQRFSERLPELKRRYRKRVNPVAALFGANASGKSNILSAVEALKFFVLYPPRADEPLTYQPFRLRETASQEPTRFEVLFEHEGYIYEYTVAFNRDKILEESLTKFLSQSEQILYRRDPSDKNNPLYLPTLAHQGVDGDRVRSALELTALNMPLASQVAALAIDASPELQSALDELLVVRRWISKLWIYRAGDFDIGRDPTGLPHWRELITQIDAGISGVAAMPVSLSSLELSQSRRDSFVQALSNGVDTIDLELETGRYELEMVDEELVAKRLLLKHAGEDPSNPVPLHWFQESDGTKAAVRLLGLFAILSHPDSGWVVLIDEIDRSFHTELSRALLRGFLDSASADSRSQLIFTTHDLLLMDPDLFRRDEMWIVEKDYKGRTELIPLSDYDGIRKDADIRKHYLQGRFGGVPVIEPLRVDHG